MSRSRAPASPFSRKTSRAASMISRRRASADRRLRGGGCSSSSTALTLPAAYNLPMEQVKPKRTRLRAEERREIIVEAARKVFLESGFAGARTRRIAEEAGITEALLYRFFPSKSEIFRAAVHEPLERFVEELLATTADIDPDEGDRR